MKTINIMEAENGFTIYLVENTGVANTMETRVAHTSNHVAEIVYGYLSPKQEEEEKKCDGKASSAKTTDAIIENEVTERFGYPALDFAIRNTSLDAPASVVLESAKAFLGFLSGK